MDPSIYHGPLPLLLEGAELADTPVGTLDSYTFDILVESTDWRASLASAGIIKSTQLPASFAFHSMWAQDSKLKDIGPLTALVSVNAIGLLLPSEKRKTTIAASTNRISIGPGENKAGPLRDMDGNPVKFDMSGYVVPEGGGTPVPRERYPSRIFGETSTEAPAWSIASAKISLTSTWFTTIRPDHLAVGAVIAPPLAIDAPTFPFGPADWSDLQFRLNDPSGWVLDARAIDELFTGQADALTSPHYLPPPSSEAYPTGLWAVVDTISYYLVKDPT